MPRAGLTTSQRGYDGDHKQLKVAYNPIVAAGQGWCTEVICLLPSRWIDPATKWDLAHDRTTGGYLGPAHVRCNRAEGAAFGNRLRGIRRHGLPDPTGWQSEHW